MKKTIEQQYQEVAALRAKGASVAQALKQTGTPFGPYYRHKRTLGGKSPRVRTRPRKSRPPVTIEVPLPLQAQPALLFGSPEQLTRVLLAMARQGGAL